MIKSSVITVGLVLAVSGCSSSDYVRACATTHDDPPIVRPMTECDKNGAGVRLFSTHKSNLEEDDIPIVGQELDDDFYGSWTVFTAPKTTKAKPSTKKPTATKKPTTTTRRK